MAKIRYCITVATTDISLNILSEGSIGIPSFSVPQVSHCSLTATHRHVPSRPYTNITLIIQAQCFELTWLMHQYVNVGLCHTGGNTDA